MGLVSPLLGQILLIVVLAIAWCEYGYYYFILYVSCPGWPAKGGLNILVISDTHIMGRRKSYKIDKVLREWQMQQAFKISNILYLPDIVIFLGDLLDEGYFVSDKEFLEAIRDFDRIFPHGPPNQKRVVVPGNHDIGFHNRMAYIPYLLDRFSANFNSTSNMDLLEEDNLNLVTVNSMSFYNDTCPICTHSKALTNHFVGRIGRRNSMPMILLTHIPLYRTNNAQGCEYPRTMSERVMIPNSEGADVLHEKSSQYLIERLRPNLILSGHTHLNCRHIHRYPKLVGHEFEEVTVTSYNQKYAFGRAGFLLVSIKGGDIFKQNCDLADFAVVASIYAGMFILICFWILRSFRNRQVVR